MLMRYVDTSVLLAFLLPEAGSDAAEQFMTSDGAPLAISAWSEVELLSALGIKLRSGQVSLAEAHSAMDAYTLSLSPHLRRLAVRDADLRLAAILLDGWATPLRAGDGLHLAIARANNATVHTFDKAMTTAGMQLGVAVTLLEIS